MNQIILVVESNEKAKTDDRYLARIIKEQYDIVGSNDIKIQYVHMGGKGHYKDKSVVSKINKFITLNKNGINKVVYCFDTDKIHSSQEDLRIYEQEKQYCKDKNFLLVWFDSDIEYVLLGNSVASCDKKKESLKFCNRFYDKNKLFANIEKLGYSNLLTILDSLLK